MKLVEKEITLEELKQMSTKMFESLVKAVVDIEKNIMVVDADMHVDEEEFLLEMECEQKNLWGINLHPHKFPDESWIEFDSMINIRPSLENRSRYVNNAATREKIISIVNKLVKK